MTHRIRAGLIAALVATSAPLQVQASGSDLNAAARLADVQVNLMSVVPGTSSGGGDWCIGTERVMLTAIVVDPSIQGEVTEGTVVWQVCEGGAQLDGFPKEDCVAPGPARWRGAASSDLAFDSTPSIGTEPLVPVLGFRLQFRPAAGSGLARATSAPFNLVTTCSP